MAREDFSFDIDPQEWATVIAMCKELPAKVGQNAFRRSIKEGLDIVLGSMQKNIQQRAEDPTGLLERSLTTKFKRKYEPSFWHGAVAVNTGKKRGDGAFYWNMVEHGHRIVTFNKIDTGRRVKAMQYAISAYETNKTAIVSDFTVRAKAEIQRSFNRRAK